MGEKNMKTAPPFIDVKIKWRPFTSFEFYDEKDSPLIVTDTKCIEVWVYENGLDGTGKRMHEGGWFMKGDEFGLSDIACPKWFIRQKDLLNKITQNF